MVVEVQQLSVYRGDTYPFQLTFWHDDAHTLPYPVDSADELLAEVRVRTGSPVLATFIVSITTPPNVVSLTLPAQSTLTLPYGSTTLMWDLQATWRSTSPATVITLARGKILVVGDVTASTATIGTPLAVTTKGVP